MCSCDFCACPTVRINGRIHLPVFVRFACDLAREVCILDRYDAASDTFVVRCHDGVRHDGLAKAARAVLRRHGVHRVDPRRNLLVHWTVHLESDGVLPIVQLQPAHLANATAPVDPLPFARTDCLPSKRRKREATLPPCEWQKTAPPETWTTASLTNFLAANPEQAPSLVGIDAIEQAEVGHAFAIARFQHPILATPVRVRVSLNVIDYIPQYRSVLAAHMP